MVSHVADAANKARRSGVGETDGHCCLPDVLPPYVDCQLDVWMMDSSEIIVCLLDCGRDGGRPQQVLIPMENNVLFLKKYRLLFSPKKQFIS